MPINYIPADSGTTVNNRLMQNLLETTLSADVLSGATEIFLTATGELPGTGTKVVIIYDGSYVEQIVMVSHDGTSTILSEELMYGYSAGSVVIIGLVVTGD